MATTSQTRRLFTLTTPLGADAFLVTGFAGREQMSRPFAFALDVVSETAAVAPADLVGQPVGWTVNTPADAPRYFHGFVKRLVAGPGSGRGLRSYRLEVVPWLWFLTRTADCRIFQNKTAAQIVADVFGLFGFTAFRESYQGTFPVREYCVQYRETAFDFVSRLMEEAGIYYYFEFADGSHTLVLADAPAAYGTCGQATVEYRPEFPGDAVVSGWDRAYEFRSGKATHTDYNFETPATSLLKTTATTVDLPDIASFEMFDYPGRYGVGADGAALAKIRIEELEVGYDTATGAGGCSSFAAGATFELTNHPADAGSYVLLAVEHTGTESRDTGAGGGAAAYGNTFTCAPAATPFRPARTTPRPVVSGPQPAVVVGPSGEEIYTDQYGRIKAQFFWDRLGTKDENSSCWMRVAEMWAGKNWGMVFTPRVGQEVLVEFLEGDPDRPVVTGRVYNADQMPPYALPANMTQSGVKTRSTKTGAAEDFNELRFEDKKDSEDIYFHAQKDFHRKVENDDDTKVDHDQTITVKNNRTLVVSEGYEKITIEKGDRERTVTKGKDTLTVSEGDRKVTVSKGDYSLTVSTGKRTVEVKADHGLTVLEGNRAVTVSKGNDTLTVTKGDVTVEAAAGAELFKAAKSITLQVGANKIVIDTAGVVIDAAKISLKVGGNTLDLAPAGFEVKGLTVKITADTQAKIAGLMTAVDGSAMTKVSGGVVMIN